MKKFWTKVCNYFSNLFKKAKKLIETRKNESSADKTIELMKKNNETSERILKKLDKADKILDSANKKLESAKIKIMKTKKGQPTLISLPKPTKSKLTPKKEPSKTELTKAMKLAVSEEKYELAAKLRDQIKSMS